MMRWHLVLTLTTEDGHQIVFQPAPWTTPTVYPALVGAAVGAQVQAVVEQAAQDLGRLITASLEEP